MTKALHCDFILHEIPQSIIKSDIRIFFDVEFQRIRKDKCISSKDWPGNDKIDCLVEKSDGLFIYAATVCRFIEDSKWTLSKQLSIVLDQTTSSRSPEKYLDEM
jgi:hypothetical protein